MAKQIKRVVAAVLLFLIAVSAGGAVREFCKYQQGRDIYEQAAGQFIKEGNGGAAKEQAGKGEEQEGKQSAGIEANGREGRESAGIEEGEQEGKQSAGIEEEQIPIEVDFHALQSVNQDAIGWLYCEGTVISYPVMQGRDNDFYLHHAYDGTDSFAGTPFIDAGNSGDFSDSNSIIYGHHLKDGTMFSSLADWEEQSYYEEHPIMWLLTPEQDYKVVLFSGYTTSAYSDSFLLFQNPCAEFSEYLEACVEASDFQADVELPEDGRYIMLSTCEYAYKDARYVLHGLLVPVY